MVSDHSAVTSRIGRRYEYVHDHVLLWAKRMAKRMKLQVQSYVTRPYGYECEVWVWEVPSNSYPRRVYDSLDDAVVIVAEGDLHLFSEQAWWPQWHCDSEPPSVSVFAASAALAGVVVAAAVDDGDVVGTVPS